MSDGRDSKLNWLDLLWLLLLAGLAILPPIQEYHKQLILLAFGILQLSEGWLIARLSSRGPAYIVLLKIALATALIDHTLGRVLFLSLSRRAGVRNWGRELRTAGDPHSVLLSCRNAGEPIRGRKPAPD